MATRHALRIISNGELPPAPLRAASSEEGKTENFFVCVMSGEATGCDTCSKDLEGHQVAGAPAVAALVYGYQLYQERQKTAERRPLVRCVQY